MICAAEPFADAAPAIRPLVDAHWAEAGSFKDAFQQRIDWPRYQAMADSGALLCVTARDAAGGLHGYMIGVVGRDLHRITQDGEPVMTCSVIVYYMRPEARGHARSLARAMETAAVARGCLMLIQRAKPGVNRAGEFFQRIGYGVSEIGYAKLIGAARANDGSAGA